MALDFALALEECIRETARTLLSSAATWADHCTSPAEKVRRQSSLLGGTLTALHARFGYPAALWCAVYASFWPQGWPDRDWSREYMCPEERVCSADELLAHTARWERQWPKCTCRADERLGESAEDRGWRYIQTDVRRMRTYEYICCL